MIIVEINWNAILVEPMKNCKDTKMIRTYKALLLQLKRAGIVPKKHVLDNEVSENMKNHICDRCKLEMELVTQGCHRCNAAKVAIHNFKAHFLCTLGGVANNFPPNLWDWLLPQIKIMINLIWQSYATPNVWHMHISADPLTKAKCHLLQWDMKSRCMRKPTNAVHGHIIWSTDGTS
jgi:hypothetical protein